MGSSPTAGRRQTFDRPATARAPDPIKVLVADTQRLFSEALAIALRSAGDFDVITDYPTTGSSALVAHARNEPEVVLLDYWMAGLNGPATTRAIHQCHPATKVLLLSWIHGPDHIQEALQSGAVGFLPKSLMLKQVAEAIRSAHSGKPLVFAEQLAELSEAIEARHERAATAAKQLATLTARELEVLQLMIQGLDLSEISRELNVGGGTTKNHIYRILKKLGTHSRLDAVAIAQKALQDGSPLFPPCKPVRGIGYLFSPVTFNRHYVPPERFEGSGEA